MTLLQSCEQDREKRAAAAWAVAEVKDDVVLGLDSGSTAAFAVEAVAARVAKSLRVVAIPSSETMADLAQQFGEIPDPAALEVRLCAIIGVVENRLFVGLASESVVGRPAGVEVIER